MKAAWKDPEIKATLMWSMDQKRKVPELWEAYSCFSWKDRSIQKPGYIPPALDQSLYSAVTTASRGLRVRLGPGTHYAILEVLPRGTRLDVYAVVTGWAQVDLDGTRWVSTNYLKQV